MQKITLTPEGQIYIASGAWDFLSVVAVTAWDQASLNHQEAFLCWKFQVTQFHVANEWSRALSGAVCITNIGWKKWWHEKAGDNSEP